MSHDVELSGGTKDAIHFRTPAQYDVRCISRVPQVGHGDETARAAVVGFSAEAQAQGSDDLLVLEKPRAGRGIGQDHAVHHEVAVVDHLPEVAAVGEELRAVGRGGADAVVPPLPDEPSV
ncbi:hypothetical protein D3C73_1224770 [compost metagenome]